MRTRFNDLTGRVFGHWTVTRLSDKVSKTGALYWEAACVCGAKSEVRGTALTSGTTESCGCMKPAAVASARASHGLARAPIYHVWASMRARCKNPNRPEFSNYGGRGITVCSRWESFDAFFSDMGNPPFKGAQIDRIDNSRGYEPGNVRWVTAKQNMLNRRVTRTVSINGEVMPVVTASELTGIKVDTLKDRANKGWEGDRLIAPVRSRKANK